LETLIVGGGFTGLAIAEALERNGQTFQLIEAQDRLGGRILTRHFEGAAYDLGPTWFWPGQPKIAALINRFGLQAFEQFSSGRVLLQDAKGDVHTDVGFSSMQGSLRVQGGMQTLIDRLVANIPSDKIACNTTLAHAKRGAIGIDAHFSNGQVIHCERLVLAVPPRIAAGTIEMTPPYSAEQYSALQQTPTWMAGQAKIVALYQTPFWREAGLSGDASSQTGPLSEIHDASPDQGGPFALFGFVGVPSHLRARKDDAVIAAAIAQLARLFGAEAARPLHVFYQDWAQIAPIAAPKDRAPLDHHPLYGRPAALTNLWQGSLTIASTEMAEVFGGYLEGALVTADSVLASYPKRS
jgi:monoamine oxidase